jgi:hypothetical protein
MSEHDSIPNWQSASRCDFGSIKLEMSGSRIIRIILFLAMCIDDDAATISKLNEIYVGDGSHHRFR